MVFEDLLYLVSTCYASSVICGVKSDLDLVMHAPALACSMQVFEAVSLAYNLGGTKTHQLLPACARQDWGVILHTYTAYTA